MTKFTSTPSEEKEASKNTYTGPHIVTSTQPSRTTYLDSENTNTITAYNTQDDILKVTTMASKSPNSTLSHSTAYSPQSVVSKGRCTVFLHLVRQSKITKQDLNEKVGKVVSLFLNIA